MYARCLLFDLALWDGPCLVCLRTTLSLLFVAALCRSTYVDMSPVLRVCASTIRGGCCDSESFDSTAYLFIFSGASDTASRAFVVYKLSTLNISDKNSRLAY